MKRKIFQFNYVSKKEMNKFREELLSAKRPDHTELKKESEEFLEYIKTKRSMQKE